MPLVQKPIPPFSFWRAACVVIILAQFCASGFAQSNEWNQFRGLGGGVATESRAPVELKEPTWKVPVAAGLSSPVLSSGRIFLTSVEDGRLTTQAFDAESGKSLWKMQAPEVPLEIVHAEASPASPTPLVDAARVIVYFGSYGLLCYDHNGVELWKKPIPTPKSLYGMTTSPIGHGEKVILVLDNDADLPDSKFSQSKVIAFSRSTGEAVWETARPFVRSGWSTPTIWRHESGEELVVLGSGRLTSYDPNTGLEKWFTTGFSRETIAQPVCGKDLLFASASMLGGVADEQPDPEPFWKAMLQFDVDSDGKVARGEITEHFTFPLRPELPLGQPGFGIPLPSDAEQRKKQQNDTFNWMDKNKDDVWTRDEFVEGLKFDRGKPKLVAIRPGGTGELDEAYIAWQLSRSIPEIPTPLYHNDRLYLVRSGGILSCVNAINGELIYVERLGATGQYSASPVIAGEHLFLVSNLGVVSVVKTGDEYALAHQHDLGEPAFVTPAFDERTIYIRTKAHLSAFRAPAEE